MTLPPPRRNSNLTRHIEIFNPASKELDHWRLHCWLALRQLAEAEITVLEREIWSRHQHAKLSASNGRGQEKIRRQSKEIVRLTEKVKRLSDRLYPEKEEDASTTP